MRWKNNDKIYGSVSRIFHWLIVGLLVLMVLLFVCAFIFPYKKTVFDFYHSIGLLIFALTIARVLWRVYNPAPALPPLIKKNRPASKIAHIVFYVLLLAIPLIGWLANSAFGNSIKFFGLFSLPMLVKSDFAMAVTLIKIYYNLVGVLILLIMIHIGAVFYYRKTLKLNLMYRIWPVLKR